MNDGSIIELFNGPEKIVQKEYIEKRKLSGYFGLTMPPISV
jgi:hypothetical protein